MICQRNGLNMFCQILTYNYNKGCTDSDNKLHAYANGLMKGGNEYSKTRQNLPRYKLKSTNFN